MNMKKATKHVLKAFPYLEKYAKKEGRSEEEVLKSLLDEEKVAMKMIWFFETPKSGHFDLKELYDHLTDSQLASALEAVNMFFLEDTYLMKDENVSIIREEDEYLNKTSFAAFLTENGVSFSRAKLSMYDKRGVLPKGDIIIAGAKYWRKATCEKYLNNIKNN